MSSAQSPRGPIRWIDRFGLRRPRPEESTAWEIEHHLSELTDQLMKEGWDPVSARREAERRFGNLKGHAPRMRRAEASHVARDRWAARVELFRRSAVTVGRFLRRQPGLAAGIVVTLALGIGANATMYGIIDRLLLRPPEHIVDPDRVVRIHGQVQFNGQMLRNPLTYPDYVDLRGHSGFTGIAGYQGAYERTVGSGDTAERFQAAMAAAELFPLLGVSPMLGRFFTPEEAQPGSQATIVLASEYWHSRFDADPAILGQTLQVDGRAHTVIGVAPPRFTGVRLERVDAWLPLELTQVADRACLDTRDCYWLDAVARLAVGVSTEAASVEAFAIVKNAREAIGARITNISGYTFSPLIAARGPEASAETRVARWLTGVSLIVLLVACANVANLLTARGVRRRKELGIRLALGAGQRAVVAQTVIESLLLASIGGVLALVIAHWGGSLVRGALFPDVFFPDSALSPRLLLFTLLAAAGAGLVSGIGPALQSRRVNVVQGLQQEGLAFTPRGSRLRSGLTIAQAAMTVVLLIGAGLFVRSVAAIRSLDLGLDVDQLVMVGMYIEPQAERVPGRRTELYQEAARRVLALQGVMGVAATGSGLSSLYSTGLRLESGDSMPRLPGGGPYQSNVSADYLDNVGLRVLRGRGIDDSDVGGSERVMVVSDLMASTVWPVGEAIGQCIFVGRSATDCTRVVGVVEDAVRNGIEDPPAMAYYVPATQSDREYNALYVRAETSAADIVSDVATALRAFSPDVRYVRAQTLRDYFDPQARSWTMGATMFTLFGILALVVAAVGLYSLLAFDVAQRTRELGIRATLGARKASLLRRVLAQGVGLGAAGIAVGLVIAYAAAPYAQDLLFDVQARDVGTFATVAVVLVVVSVLASLMPALRATRVDPMRALRAD